MTTNVISAVFKRSLSISPSCSKRLSQRTQPFNSASRKPKIVTPNQRFAYFLLLDFEATCDKSPDFFPPEIIEFPVLKVDSKTFQVSSLFHSCVRPVINPSLTPFCTQLTGTIQEDVEGQPTLSDTLNAFHEWMGRERLFDQTFAFVTFGDWDLSQMLPSECDRLGIPVPQYMREWIDLKKSYSLATGRWSRSLMTMLDDLKLQPKGRAHSGIDDCGNMARIMETLSTKKKFVYQITSSLEQINKLKPLKT